ncbi:MAG: AbrB/MazE/SpoVT family DNA-binding domain-containing protein [Candidatus Woesearchaeota archaeon]
MAVQVVIKKWGNSMGVVIPRELVEQESLKENEKVLIEMVKEADLTGLFGALKRKMSGQEFKDMVRKGWKA